MLLSIADENEFSFCLSSMHACVVFISLSFRKNYSSISSFSTWCTPQVFWKSTSGENIVWSFFARKSSESLLIFLLPLLLPITTSTTHALFFLVTWLGPVPPPREARKRTWITLTLSRRRRPDRWVGGGGGGLLLSLPIFLAAPGPGTGENVQKKRAGFSGLEILNRNVTPGKTAEVCLKK